MIGRVDIEESKSNVAMNAWLPQASYPCGNFSGTYNLMNREVKGTIVHAFAVCVHTENQNQVNFSSFGPQEISVPFELTFGQMRYHLTDVPSQTHYVFRLDRLSLNPKISKGISTPRNN